MVPIEFYHSTKLWGQNVSCKQPLSVELCKCVTYLHKKSIMCFYYLTTITIGKFYIMPYMTHEIKPAIEVTCKYVALTFNRTNMALYCSMLHNI